MQAWLNCAEAVAGNWESPPQTLALGRRWQLETGVDRVDLADRDRADEVELGDWGGDLCALLLLARRASRSIDSVSICKMNSDEGGPTLCRRWAVSCGWSAFRPAGSI